MVEAEGMPPTANVASPGLRLNYIGEHCYAMNSLGVADSETTMLEFTTGEGYILATLQPGKISNTGDDIGWIVYFNEQVVYGFFTGDSSINEVYQLPLNLLLPPFTNFKATAENVSDTSTDTITGMFVGRVYDV